MKKKLFVLIIFIFLLCGCSNTLVCEKETNKEIDKVIIKFEKDMPISLSWKRTLVYQDGDALIEMNYYEEKNYYNKYDYTDGFTYKIDKKDRKGKIVIDVNVDYSKYDISTDVKLPSIYIDRENNKYYLENNGYECK